MAKLKVKLSPKGETFEEKFGLTEEQMNELGNTPIDTENTERVHKAMLCNVLLNTKGEIPVAIIAAAFTDNHEYDPEIVVPISDNPAKVLKALYKKIGHTGAVKMIAAVEENNAGVDVTPMSFEEFMEDLMSSIEESEKDSE